MTIREAIDIAIGAMGKQAPLDPPEHDRFVCPICNSKWYYGNPGTYYCCHCGQRINLDQEGGT